MLGIFTDDFFPYIGGMGRYVYEIVRRLPHDRLTVFSPCENQLPGHIRVSPILHDRFRNISYSLWMHHRLPPIVERFQLKRINIQCGPGGLFLFRKPPVPVVATCYHTWWQQSRYIPSQVWKRVFVPFEIMTYRMADRILCISEDSRRILTDHYRIDPEKTVVIHPGIDADKFVPLDNVEKIPDSILYVGRVDKRKGVDFLVRSMTRVVDRLSSACLYIGGTGRDVSALKNFVRSNGLEKNVKFLGFIPDEDLNLWYNRVNCVVIPSVFEGFGLTAVEAMSAGASVICTAVDSLRHIVLDGICGYQVEYNDAAGLGSKIVTLLEDPQLQKRFSQQGRKRVESLYNWDFIIQKLEPVLIGEPAASDS